MVRPVEGNGRQYTPGTIIGRYNKPIPPAEKRRSFGIYRTMTVAGENINEDNVIELDTVLACIRVLGESLAALPLNLMERRQGVAGEEEVVAVDHPLYDLVRSQPNEEMTAYEMRLWMVTDMLIRGRGVAQIVRNGRGRPLELWPLESAKLLPKRTPPTDGSRLVYTYAEVDSEGKKHERLLEADEVLEFKVLPFGSLMGYSLTKLAKETFGSAKAAESYTAEFYANGGVITGTLSVPEELSEEAFQRLKKDWQESQTGKGNRHKVPLLEGGAKFDVNALNHQETQFLETLQFKRSTIAGIFRVPAHMINDLEKATFSNIEHQDLGFVKHSLRPHMTNIEQKADMRLLSKVERKRYFFKHNDRDLLRGDFPTRAEGYSKLVQCGVLLRNEVRRVEGWPGYKGGDEPLVNGTMINPNNPPPKPATQNAP